MKAPITLSFLTLLASSICGFSQANIYSQNIVGYAKVNVPPGYSLMANPLSTGSTNAANEIMPILDGEIILTWNGILIDTVKSATIPVLADGFGKMAKLRFNRRLCLLVQLSFFSTL